MSQGTRSRLQNVGLTLTTTLGCVTLAALSACSSGSSGGGGAISLQSLSGSVRGAGGGALEGVTVSVGTASGVSDANGDFIIPSVGSISAGTVTVTFDGSTSVSPGTFPTLDVFVPLSAGVTELVMPQVITLPDLASVNSAMQTVSLAPDGSTTAPIAVSGVLPDLGLSAATGTIITIDGMVGVASMADINITPVDPIEVPMPLGEGMLGGSFVTIQPSNGTFDQPGAAMGLDVVFPNVLDLPVGTVVDIWSFDHDDHAWVNRSLETGETGLVVDVGGGMTEIQASGVITEGGWHTPVVTVDVACATTFSGRIVDDMVGSGIEGATVALSTAQFTTTDANGDFSISSVPAYDAAANAASSTCTVQAFDYEIVLPPAYGSVSSGTVTVPSGSVVAGGTTTIANVVFTIPTTGSLAGIVNGDAANPDEEVYITSDPVGAYDTSVEPDSSGAFFLTGIPEGDYIASFLFAGQANPTEFSFAVTANQISTLALQFAQGVGNDDIVITVFEDDDEESTPVTPLAGAQVVLQGTDAGSMLGLIMTTDMNGQATFEDVDGPFTVTAVKDFLDGQDTLRIATTLVDIAPTNDTIGIQICFEQEESPIVLDATLDGVVSNMPMLAAGQSLVVIAESDGLEDVFTGQALVNPMDGTYSMPVPSGIGFDTMLALIDDNAPSPVQASLFQPGIAPVNQGDSGVASFDYASPSLVAWTQTVNATFSNVDSGSMNVELELCIIDRANEVVFFADLYDDVPGATTLTLPDVTDAAFSGYEFVLAAETDFTGSVEQECTRTLTTNPSSLTFNFLPAGSAISPTNGATYTIEEVQDLMVSFNEAPNGSLGTNGPNIYFFEAEGGTPPSGVDATCWTVYMAAGTEMFDMPVNPLPMFGDGQLVYAGFEQARFGGTTFAFNSFFNGNFDQNFETLFEDMTSSYQSLIEIEFDIDAGN